MDLMTSTPTAGGSSAKLSFEDASIVTAAAVKRKPVNLELILKAIQTVGVKRKGASLQAIKKYIEGSLSQPLDKRINTAIKRSLLKGIENGQLIRPVASQNAIGCTGFFMLSKTSKVKKKPSSPKEQVSDSEAIQDFKAKRKLNVTKMPKSKKKDEKENVKSTASKSYKNSKATKLNSEAGSTKKKSEKTGATNEKAKRNKDKPESEVEEVGTEVKTAKRRVEAKSGKRTAKDKTKAKPDTESVKDNAVEKARKGKKENKPIEINTEEVVMPTRNRPAKNNIEGAKPTKGKTESKAKVNAEEGKKPKGKPQRTTRAKLNKVGKIAKEKLQRIKMKMRQQKN